MGETDDVRMEWSPLIIIVYHDIWYNIYNIYIYIIFGFAMNMLSTTVRSIYNGIIYILFMDVKGNIMEYHGIILIECI